MPEQPDLCLHAARAGKSAQPACAENAVTGDDHRDRIGRSGPTNCLGGDAWRFRERAIGAGLAKRDLLHRGAELLLQDAAPGRARQGEGRQCTVEIGGDLAVRLSQKRCVVLCPRRQSNAPITPPVSVTVSTPTGEGIERVAMARQWRRLAVRSTRFLRCQDAARLSSVMVSKSSAEWRSCNCMAGSPKVRLTMRPRCTAGRASIRLAQSRTCV